MEDHLHLQVTIFNNSYARCSLLLVSFMTAISRNLGS